MSDKDRCLIFLDNFNDIKQSKLVEGMHGRYGWTKVRQNALVGKFDDILYRLLRQQKEEREKVKLGEVKDGEIYKTLTCMREMMEGMEEERLKLQVMLAKEKHSKRKEKESVAEESDSESEEEKEPPRKLTKAKRKVLNQIRGGHETSRKQGKNSGQNNQGGNGGADAGSSGQSSQDQGQFQPQGGGGRGRGRGNGQRSRWAWQQEATCNYCAEKGHIMRFCQLLSKDEKEGIVFATIRGEVFDYEGNLIDPNIEGGMRKEAFRQMGRPLSAMFRIASPEEARLAGVEEVMASLHIDDPSAEPGREDASGQAGTTAPGEASQTEPMVSTMRPRTVLKRSAPTVAVQTRMRRRNEQLRKERGSEKAVEEEPIPVSENDEDSEDEKLRAEEEERARRCALEREPEKGKAEVSEEESRKKKNIYSIPVEQGVDIEQLVNKILESQRDLVTLKEILAVSPKMREEFKQRMTRSCTKDLTEVLPSIRRFVWEHINDVVKALKRLREFNLTASGIKSRHCMKRAVILGFLCDEKGRRPDAKKTNKILEWSTPFKSITDVRSFLGTCGFWCIFIRRFAPRREHLRKFVRKGQKWEWGPKQQAVVEDIKIEFREGGLILGVLFFDDDEKRPSVIETDAGSTALGGVLIQRDVEGQERPLRFDSRTLNVAERNYSQFKKEILVVLHCFRIFRNYVFGRRFILRVDLTALKEEESQLSINYLAYLTDAATRHGKSIWNAPAFHEVRPELVMEEPVIEEDPWGEQTAEEMMRLAFTDDIDLRLDPLTIE
ncbi:hypothetical protein CBR_g5714 [Chara braunii]|uniref:Reverse transcriptase RNase H-like domain-containing protein n=1 Tax=Chara braunii TaxID=69332 RepID=A0A388KJ58_CHABU|nr:hypothetical protein CBR_g5714 [Chara braunii]|eukprot:GBG70082.1 hypothetical protein CBR_g5714 [Chara braunii]